MLLGFAGRSRQASGVVEPSDDFLAEMPVKRLEPICCDWRDIWEGESGGGGDDYVGGGGVNGVTYGYE